MHIKTIVSAATLAIALGFSGGVFAQAVTIGGQTVTDADVERVTAFCADLQAKSTAASDGSENTDGADATPPGDTSEGAETGTEEGSAGLVKLDEITLEQCVEAGLVTN